MTLAQMMILEAIEAERRERETVAELKRLTERLNNARAVAAQEIETCDAALKACGRREPRHGGYVGRILGAKGAASSIARAL